MNDVSPAGRARPIEDVGVVGAGIVGLAHAWSAARRGHRVTVFERGAAASGASIRNFGMIWPIGQPAGEAHALALRSRQAWLELARDAGIWVNPVRLDPSGTPRRRMGRARRVRERRAGPRLHVSSCSLARRCCAAPPPPTRTACSAVCSARPSLAVNPRTAVRALPGWLASRLDVRFEFGTTITNVEPGRVRSADGRKWAFDRTIVCGGADFETLFPEVFRDAGLSRCKLQMLKTVPQPQGWTIGPHLASGLTLRHYANFAVAASLDVLKQRIAAETPELDRYGIHVMASQNDAGEVILGDSHEYDSAIEPFDKAVIDDLILRELRRVIRLPSWEIAERWHGVYAKNGRDPFSKPSPCPASTSARGPAGRA